VPKLGMPTSLAGKRCLDVGTSDGFWAFEMERRGAAEVVAIDINDPGRYDWPEPRPAHPSRPANVAEGENPGFRLAHETFGSKVKRVDCRIYDLDPNELGQFDFAFMGSLALHLRDPVLAFASVRTMVKPDGQFLSADSISQWLTRTHPRRPTAHMYTRTEPIWWLPNHAAYKRMLVRAGFEILQEGKPYKIPFGKGAERPMRPTDYIKKLRKGSLTWGNIAHEMFVRRQGAPTAWALCRPAVDGAADKANR